MAAVWSNGFTPRIATSVLALYRRKWRREREREAAENARWEALPAWKRECVAFGPELPPPAYLRFAAYDIIHASTDAACAGIIILSASGASPDATPAALVQPRWVGMSRAEIIETVRHEATLKEAR